MNWCLIDCFLTPKWCFGYLFIKVLTVGSSFYQGLWANSIKPLALRRTPTWWHQLTLHPLSPSLTSSQFEAILLPFILLVFHHLTAVQEGLLTGCTIHNVIAAPLTGVWNRSLLHAIQTTVTLQLDLIFTHWKERGLWRRHRGDKVWSTKRTVYWKVEKKNKKNKKQLNKAN